jgi:hypothetical protein
MMKKNDLNMLYVKTLNDLLKDTPNIKEYLKEKKRLNPNGYRPSVLFVINLFMKIKKIVLSNE